MMSCMTLCVSVVKIFFLILFIFCFITTAPFYPTSTSHSPLPKVKQLAIVIMQFCIRLLPRKRTDTDEIPFCMKLVWVWIIPVFFSFSFKQIYNQAIYVQSSLCFHVFFGFRFSSGPFSRLYETSILSAQIHDKQQK